MPQKSPTIHPDYALYLELTEQQELSRTEILRRTGWTTGKLSGIIFRGKEQARILAGEEPLPPKPPRNKAPKKTKPRPAKPTPTESISAALAPVLAPKPKVQAIQHPPAQAQKSPARLVQPPTVQAPISFKIWAAKHQHKLENHGLDVSSKCMWKGARCTTPRATPDEVGGCKTIYCVAHFIENRQRIYRSASVDDNQPISLKVVRFRQKLLARRSS